MTEKDWQILLRRIKDGKCTPFLGAGACYGILPLGSEVAQRFAREYEYPLQYADDLAKVAQYVAVTQDPMRPKEELKEWFGTIAPPDFSDPDEPHGVLADLPLPLYMTTNYDDFMIRALRDRKRDPRREMCRWNESVRQTPTIFETEAGYVPTPSRPLVYHLHGFREVEESLVLTDDDYIDFLISISKDEDLLHPQIRKAFTGTSLLFLGYRLADPTFWVLFRSLCGYLQRSISRTHVSVQIAHFGPEMPSEQQEKVTQYFESYLGRTDIRVFWGTCREFVSQLRKRWEEFSREPALKAAG